MDYTSFKKNLASAVVAYPPLPKRLSYGTAGFRDRYDLPLDVVFFKMGILAYLRSCSVRGLPLVGVMITASHNAEIDNGIKIVDPDGGMLDQSWEPLAESLVNASTLQEVLVAVDNIVEQCRAMNDNFDSELPFQTSASVVIGRDCRPHSSSLAACTCAGVHLCGGKVLDLGEVTTPQLHFTVQSMNSRASKVLQDGNSAKALQLYYDTLAQGYIDLSMTAGKRSSGLDAIVVDGARGIGAAALSSMNLLAFAVKCPTMISVDIRNDVGSGPVNEGCGAELVQKGQVFPAGVCAEADAGKVLCSFDGDADRIVFHSFLPTWTLFDGDKISVLFAMLISQEMRAAGLQGHFSLGVVQTAYANGASAHFFRSNKIPTVMAKTGVKYLHHKALNYDVGIYFEANGHGTVLFSNRFLLFISQKYNDVINSNKSSSVESPSTYEDSAAAYVTAIRRLYAVTRVINQAVGDAISDMLFVLAALRVLGLDLYSWNSLYADLPSKQVKIAVSSSQKAQIVCSEDESCVTSPVELQRGLDDAMARVPMGRVFVRPSGTEDVVRVYAEASTAAGALELEEAAKKLIASTLK